MTSAPQLPQLQTASPFQQTPADLPKAEKSFGAQSGRSFDKFLQSASAEGDSPYRSAQKSPRGRAANCSNQRAYSRKPVDAAPRMGKSAISDPDQVSDKSIPKAEMTRTETKNAISVATSGSESEEISNRASGPNSEPDNTNDATVALANLTNAEISTPVPSGPGRNSQACSSYPGSSNSL